jgi:hypothetical protein
MGLRLACALPAAGDLSWSRIWSAVGLGWRDLSLGVVLSSAWVAVGAARRYALERLAIEMFERRNWCAQCGDGGLRLIDNKFSECGRLSLNEGAGLAVSALMPAIVFASVQSASEPAAFAWAVIAAAVAHGLGALLKLHQNKVDLRRFYGEGQHGRVRSSS